MIVALLDLASEHLECEAVVMVLDRGSSVAQDSVTGNGRDGDDRMGHPQKEFGELLHSLMYVGGSIVTNPPYAVDPRYVLVGIEV
jgi:hypothetical protein